MQLLLTSTIVAPIKKYLRQMRQCTRPPARTSETRNDHHTLSRCILLPFTIASLTIFPFPRHSLHGGITYPLLSASFILALTLRTAFISVIVPLQVGRVFWYVVYAHNVGYTFGRIHSHPIREACDCQFPRTTSRIFASIRSKPCLNPTFSARIDHPRNGAGCIIQKVVLLDGYGKN